jgi:hypothetical protein
MNEDVLNFLTDSANSIREQLGESEKYYLKDFANLIKKIPKGIIVIDGNEPIKNRIKDRVYFVRYKDTEGYSYKFEDYLGNELSLSCVKNILTKYKDNTLYIAASNSNIYEKRYADYVCTGTNDEKIIQKAIDELYALGGGTVKLSSGIFNIGSFTLSSDGIYRAITLPSGDKRYTIDIVGQSQMTGEKDSSSIYGTRLFVSQDVLNSIDTLKQYEVISALPSTNSPNNVIHLTEFEVRLATNQKPVVCIDLFNFGRARLDRIKCIAYTNTNASLTKAVKGCIGIRMLNGSNNGQENNFNSCGCSGFYEAFQVGGEHVVMNNCSAIKNVYGYTFGNYTYQRAFNHAITLINCCDERDVNLPYFHSNTGTQRINLIDFCIERYASATPGGVLGNLAKESKNGMFSGDISFTVMDDSATNVVNIPFFEKGNGKNFKVRNSIHALSGTTKLRESYAANQGQTYYDTDLKCLMYYLNDEWIEIAGNSNNIDNNHWKNKKWYAYGTSLTDIDNVGQYCKTVRDLSGLTLTNKGKSGGGICANTLIKDAVMNTTDGKTSADLITLEVGANDTSAILGTIYDTGDNTFCGALNQCIRYLQKNTNAQIVVISSTNSRYKSGDKTVEFTPEKTFASDNHTKYDQWKAIKEVCAINSVPYIAMGEEAGLGYARMIASDKYNIDNIHHTALAGKNLGEFVWSKLKDIPLWLSELSTTTLKITKQPTDVSVAIGDSAIFTVVAEGNNLSYQWQVSSSNGANWGDTGLDGNKTPILTVSPVGTVLNGRLYRCVVTDTLFGDTVISNAAKLTVINTSPIKITTQPIDVDSAVGNSVSFSVIAEGDTLTYQWQLSKDGGMTWGNTSVNGNTSKFINFAIPNADYNGRMFRCVITDVSGNTLASNSATLTLNGVPDVTITSQPQDVSAKVGDTINISVVAKSSKSNKLTYQWQVSSTGTTWSNTTVTGYNTSALSFAIPGTNYNGRQYRCLVTDGNGSWALSDAMTLTVTE